MRKKLINFKQNSGRLWVRFYENLRQVLENFEEFWRKFLKVFVDYQEILN